MLSITVNGQVIRTGMLFKSVRSEFEGIPIGPGVQVTVVSIGSSSIGVQADTPLPGWNDLNGEVPSNTGLWVNTTNFFSYYEEAGQHKIIIVKECSFDKSDLKGKTGKVLNQNPDGLFVELEEEIGGISFDGLGKAGHCAFVPKDCVEYVDKPNKKVKKAKK